MSPTDLVWYVSYGSNMATQRLTCYLSGGTPPGAKRACPGCRDPRPPRRAVGCHLDGSVYFATESAVWGGGCAFYDPWLPGVAPARGFLVTAEQFCDIAAQEMYGHAGTWIDLTAAVAEGRIQVGPGRYETVIHVGELDGHPMLTFTAPWRTGDLAYNAPSAAYLRMLATGLREGHDWDTERAADYLAGLPGARGHWTAPAVAEIVSVSAARPAASCGPSTPCPTAD